MPDEIQKLTKPWLLAVWPGMGQVAISAGYYLMAKMGMHLLAEFSPRELFDVEHVEVKDGLIHSARLPRSRCFLWRDPSLRHDIILFIGEAQPPTRKRAFCNALVNFATQMGVERVFTFAAMATQMHPEHLARVFGAATDEATLAELKKLSLEVMTEGHIGGLNGVLLGEAAEAGLHGACLLGEMPHIFSQIPFPGASFAVLKVFCELAEITVDLDELDEQAADMGRKLGKALAQVEVELEKARESEPADDDETPESEPVPEPKLTPQEERRITELFAQARTDRSKSYELKQELDRLQVFEEYEDDFLDLFQKPGNP
jgi:predicted ATP-grasp superfamily ATP-dependent carboligase